MNLSQVSDERTARTSAYCAQQRAENLAALGCHNLVVTELCVGPSLETLIKAYAKVGLTCWGNDIDPRWKELYPSNNWLIGNCLDIYWSKVVVFAPPLSKGCDGTRESSLRAEKVRPSYQDFLDELQRRQFKGWAVLVLPGRSWTEDTRGLHKMIAMASKLGSFDYMPLKDERHRIAKYVDIYLKVG